MTISFEGRVAIVTGAGGGLGKQHALELGRRGAKVVVNDLGGSVDGSGGSASAAELVIFAYFGLPWEVQKPRKKMLKWTSKNGGTKPEKQGP